MYFELNKPEINYPYNLIKDLSRFPQKHVIPCSALVNREEMGGLFILIPSEILRYFHISPASQPEPPFKFSMLHSIDKDYALEISLLFSETPEKYLKLQLNPHDKKVYRFLKLCSKTKMISFHFYDTDKDILSSAITNIDDEQFDWLERNCKLTKQLKPNTKGYKKVAKYLYDNSSSADRVFRYYNTYKSKYFIKDSHKIVKLGEV